jgi:hypothetical protein
METRPNNEIKSLPEAKSSLKIQRRVLAGLLRATERRMRADVMGRDRYNSRSSEISEMLAPLMVSERSLLGFYKAFCERFGVDPTGADSEWGPIEVWLTEGRIRWDRTIASLTYRDCLTLIHESADLLASYACDHYAAEGEDQMFEELDAPIDGDLFKPDLPTSLIQPNSYATVWTLTSPMHHGADVKHGNVNMFRRKPVFDAVTGRREYVPFISGNAVRGLWRDMVMGRWLQLIGLSAVEIPTARAHALLAGGAVQKGADTGTVMNEVRRRARRLCPPWDLLGGCTDQQIMSGTVRVSDTTLVCRENAWLVRDMVTVDESAEQLAQRLRYAGEHTSLRLGTRHKHADIENAEGVQMLWNTELLTEGSQMVHSVQVWGIDAVNPITAACLADLLGDFRSVGVVGAAAARGMGHIAFEPYRPMSAAPGFPDPSIYLEHIEANKSEMQDWAMMVGEIAGETEPAKKRGKKAKPLEESEITAEGHL